jgi:hypothetical protein
MELSKLVSAPQANYKTMRLNTRTRVSLSGNLKHINLHIIASTIVPSKRWEQRVSRINRGDVIGKPKKKKKMKRQTNGKMKI